MAKVLVVEDHVIVRDGVVRYLQREGFDTLTASDGEEALRLASQADLVILDLMLPKVDGLEVCRRIRVDDRVPIIMLTARGRTKDKLVGLGIGADDYVVKPFGLAELTSRVRAALRRAYPDSTNDDVFYVGDLYINRRMKMAERGGEVLDLTDREFDVLLVLARNPGKPVTREQLLDEVWGARVRSGEATVTVYINRLREKLEPDPARPRYLTTAWGIGYTLEP